MRVGVNLESFSSYPIEKGLIPEVGRGANSGSHTTDGHGSIGSRGGKLAERTLDEPTQ